MATGSAPEAVNVVLSLVHETFCNAVMVTTVPTFVHFQFCVGVVVHAVSHEAVNVPELIATPEGTTAPLTYSAIALIEPAPCAPPVAEPTTTPLEVAVTPVRLTMPVVCRHTPEKYMKSTPVFAGNVPMVVVTVLPP